MTRFALYAFSAFLALTTAACVSAPDFPVEPVIAFESLSSQDIRQVGIGSLDSIIVQFSFTDGDGDLSSLANDSVDVFLTDSRILQPRPIRIPSIPPEGTGNGISGDIFITLINDNSSSICCIFNGRFCESDPAFPVDTFSYEIQIRDRAGNFSNKIRTPIIEILCL